MVDKSIITPQRVRQAIQDRFNPIRDFTPERLVQQLDMFHTGYLADAARTWDAMERRDIYLGNVASKRKKAASRLSWDIVTTDDSPEAERQAEVLRDFYNSIRVTTVLEQNERGGVSLLIRQMMDAVGKKFAVHEIVWNQTDPVTGEMVPAEFRFCPLWWFENRTGRLRFLPQDYQLDGVEMKDGEWLVTVGEGIMESCSVFYVFKHMPLKDWIGFSEKYGMPGLLGKTQASKDSPEWEAMEEAVESFGNDWSAVCSQNDVLELVEVKGGTGNLPFPPLVEYCDRALAARWRGADLSTISAGTGQGQGASLQGDETDLLLEDDAQLISETLNDQVDRHVLRQAGFGEIKAYFEISRGELTEEDKKFRRDVIKGFMADGTVVDMIANQTDLKTLVQEVGLPVNEEYVDQYLPILDELGRLVTGKLLRDAEGDVIGALPETGSDTEGAEAQSTQRGEGLTRSREGTKVLAAQAKDGSNLQNSFSRVWQGVRGFLGLTNTSPVKPISPGAARAFAAATRAALRPAAKRLQEIYAIDDPVMQRVALRHFQEVELPRMRQDINQGAPVNAEVLRRAIEEGLAAGVAKRESVKSSPRTARRRDHKIKRG